MTALFRNDTPGTYPPSWYTASTDIPPQRAALKGEVKADVCVIGAGYTGLSAALFLAERGYSVTVLEAHRAGFGASGRNGGQVGTGFNKGQRWVEAKVGKDAARALWDMTEAAKQQVRDLSALHAPEARYMPGVAHGEYSAAEAHAVRDDVEHLRTAYGYDQIDILSEAEMQGLVKTSFYKGGILDRGAGHIHPLRYALGLARAAEAAGATILEGSPVTDVVHGNPSRVYTEGGTVLAGHVIFAGNGYLPVNLDRKISARVMPINSFIAATEPLGNRWTDILAEDIAVADSKFVVNYYRMSEDRRFLFGGRESYTLGFPSDITTKLRERMLTLFPQLGDVKVDFVWGGTLGITMTRVPAVMRVAPNAMAAAGFSGHGVALSGFAGRVMAEAVAGQAERFDILSKLPTPPFPGGSAFRAPLLTLAMTWYSMRDKLGV
jgi:gamma-glutamylputrescine oxidase